MGTSTIDYDRILSTSPFLAQWKSDIAKVLKHTDETLEDDEINEFLDEECSGSIESVTNVFQVITQFDSLTFEEQLSILNFRNEK